MTKTKKVNRPLLWEVEPRDYQINNRTELVEVDTKYKIRVWNVSVCKITLCYNILPNDLLSDTW